jgi:osomolarity two-component system sensor histidine kinase SLN1
MLKLEDVYDVVVAKDGQEAYDMVRESMAKGQYFNLIFMDIQVSPMSEMTLAQKLT